MHEEGFKGFFGGIRVGICGIVVYRSLYFGLFGTIKHIICGEQTFNEDGKPVKMSFWLSFFTAQVGLFLL